MAGKASVPRESSAAGESVAAAVLRKGRRGEHEQRDNGPVHHATILLPIQARFALHSFPNQQPLIAPPFR